MSSYRLLVLLTGLVVSGCSNQGDVLTSAGEGPDAAIVDAEAAPDAGGTIDVGPSIDVGPDPTSLVWTRLPGLYGADYRYLGSGPSGTYLMGRRHDESTFSIYLLPASGAGFQKGTFPPVDVFPPQGQVGEIDGLLLWATESTGVVVSEDRGVSWTPMALPWTDGSVGEGNGHVSRIVKGMVLDDAYCVHRRFTPWVDSVVLRDQERQEIRCFSGGSWTVETATAPAGVRHVTALGDQLFGRTSTEPGGDLCRSDDRGRTWLCRPEPLDPASALYATASGRMVALTFVPSSSGDDTFTELRVSDDDGASWSPEVVVPGPLLEVAMAGEIMYGLAYLSPIDRPVGAMFRIDLTRSPSVSTRSLPTVGQTQWMDAFAHRDELHVATTRGVRRYIDAQDRWVDVEIESAPALDVVLAGEEDVFTIDGNRTTRRFVDGQWDEIVLDDVGWGTAGFWDDARVTQLAALGAALFVGAARRKMFRVSIPDRLASPFEDLALTSQVHPSAAVLRLVVGHGRIYASLTAGEEVSQVDGSRRPWGGGLYAQDLGADTWTDLSEGLPPRDVGTILGDGVVGALYAEGDLVIAATQDGLHRSTSRGQGFERVESMPRVDATRELIRITGEGDRVWVVRDDGGGTRSWHASTDRGETFTRLTTDFPEEAQIRAIAADESAVYALADPFGVLRSIDGGATWGPYGRVEGAAFPERTFDLDIAPSRIAVGTSRGVWMLER